MQITESALVRFEKKLDKNSEDLTDLKIIVGSLVKIEEEHTKQNQKIDKLDERVDFVEREQSKTSVVVKILAAIGIAILGAISKAANIF